MSKTPINIWNDVEKTWGMRLDLVFEGGKMVGIHHSDMEDVIKELDWLIKRVKIYRDEMALFYGEKPKQNTSTRFTYVYLAKDENTGYYKIGRSLKPQFREKTLLSEKPTIKMIFTSPLTRYVDETILHRMFATKRVRGEWFDLDKKDIKIVKTYDYGS